MRGVCGAWVIVCALGWLVGCSGKSESNGAQGGGGSVASGGAPQGGLSAGGTRASGGSASGGRENSGSGGAATGGASSVLGGAIGTASGGASAGGSSNAGGVAAGGKANAGGNAGAATGGTGGASAGSSSGGHAIGGNEAVTYAPPSPGATWKFKSGDPLNSTPPVLAALQGGVVLAGASADPATVGLTAFGTGIESEAFMARLDERGVPQWRVPLLPAGLPWAIVRTGDDFVTVAPNMPDIAQVSTSYVTKDIYIAKVSSTGSVRYETTITFDYDDTYAYGLAVDSSGALYLAGGFQLTDQSGFGSHPILIKCDPSGKKLWQKTFTHTGTQGYANAITVLSNGDLVMTGAFDKEINFGAPTQTIAATATLSGLPSGFMARFKSDGTPVWSSVLGGTDFATGTALASLPDGDFLVAGATALDLALGGKTVKGPAFTPSDPSQYPPSHAFIARVTADGSARWLALEPESQFGQLTASIGATALLGGSVGSETGINQPYLLSFDLTTGSPSQSIRVARGTSPTSSAIAVADGSAWVSGRYSGAQDFGNTNVLAPDDAGVFLLRLDPQ